MRILEIATHVQLEGGKLPFSPTGGCFPPVVPTSGTPSEKLNFLCRFHNLSGLFLLNKRKVLIQKAEAVMADNDVV